MDAMLDIAEAIERWQIAQVIITAPHRVGDKPLAVEDMFSLHGPRADFMQPHYALVGMKVWTEARYRAGILRTLEPFMIAGVQVIPSPVLAADEIIIATRFP